MAAGTLAGVKWTGLDSFMAELQLLTADLVDEANKIMWESAEAARQEIRAAYPLGDTGNLRGGLVITAARGTVISGAQLKQTAPHGFIYERGTTQRTNKAGSNRGRMAGRPTFEPIATEHRKKAIEAVMLRIKAHGAANITGTPEAA
jgi:hypothetical protein